MFLSSLYESLNKEVCRQQPGLDGEDHVADIMQETRPWKDVIVDALSTGAKYTDGVRRRRPWTVDQYE